MCAKYILDIIGYSDSPPKMDQLSLYNHGNPFSTSPAIACSLILPRVPTLEIYYFKMSLLMKSSESKCIFRNSVFIRPEPTKKKFCDLCRCGKCRRHTRPNNTAATNDKLLS